MRGRDDLTDAEREALVDWWDSDWPDDVDGVIGTLQDVVAGIVGERVADAWDEGTDAVCPNPDLCSCDGLYADPIHAEDPRNPYRAAESPAESPGRTEAASGAQGAQTGAQGSGEGNEG